MSIINLRRALPLLSLLVSLLGATPATALAQSENFESFWVVLERDTELRCGDSPNWYAVANLKAGQLLRVNGESFDWYRVEYPRGTRVWIVGREAQIIENGARIETTRAAQPRAINAAAPTTESSYRRVSMESIIPPGTRFRYIGPINNNQGEADGYIIPAPEGASGFVIAASTRRATEAEVREFLAQRDQPRQQPADNDQSAEQPGQTTDQTGDQTGADTNQTQQPTNEQPDTSPEQQPAADEPAETDEPAEETPGEMEMGDTASAVENAEEAETLSPLEVVLQRSSQLDEAYAVVASQKTAEAEIRPLIQEYRDLMRLAADTELAADVQRYAQARIDLLNIRLEIQQAIEELAAIRTATDEAAENFEELDEALAGRRDYIIVGRLVPSAIYNGRRLPLMYRLQSVDGGSGRTLAYITPNEDIAIDSVLNAIVGVAGRVRPRENSGVRIIEPTVIDVLRPGN